MTNSRPWLNENAPLAAAVLIVCVATCFGLLWPHQAPKPPTSPEVQDFDDDEPGPGGENRRTTAPGSDPNYPPAPFDAVASGKWVRPRAELVGVVTYARKQADGDTHYKLEDGGKFVILESIPELVLPNGGPKVGQRIKARGVVRWDASPNHNWSELHPLVWWEAVP